MLFANPGKYEPCGLFTIGHFKLVIITILGIIIALKKTINKSKEEITDIIKKCTIIVWIWEVVIIIFKLKTGDIRNVNNYVPLYYCSILLYAGVLAAWTKGKLQRAGEVFIATGGIIGGVIFLILPSTALPTYPAWHIVSLHSFIYHGIMIYLGILINVTHYITLNLGDIKYYATLVGGICALAYIINNIFDSNLMFISKEFAFKPMQLLYKVTGPYFTLVTSVGQMTLPFYITYCIGKICNRREQCNNESKKYAKNTN